MTERGKRQPRVSPKRKSSKKDAVRRASGNAAQDYETLFRRLPVGVYRTTPEGRIIAANPAIAKMLGYEKVADLWDIDVRDFFVQADDRVKHFRNLARQGAIMSEFRLKKRDGRTIWVRDFARAVFGPDGRILCADGVMRDMSKEKRTGERLRQALKKLTEANAARAEMIQKLETISLTDDLTGLYNRRGFNVLARQHLLMADRHKTTVFLLYLDINDLKGINDTFGHRLGDEALAALAGLLKATFRISDIKARMSGDEFAIFPIDTSISGVEVALARLQKAIAEFNASGQKPFRLSISTGVARYDPANPSTIEDLLNRADNLMYEDKRKKTNAAPRK